MSIECGALPLQHHPLGSTFTGSTHSVISSLPTHQDVIGYEEKLPAVISRLKQGYPRFMRHHLIGRVCALLAERYGWGDAPVALLGCEHAVRQMRAFCGGELRVRLDGGLYAVRITPDGRTEHRARAFLQHTGALISSRQAEDWLVARGLRAQHMDEHCVSGDSCAVALQRLAPWIDGPALLTNCGANAFYSAYSAVSALQAEKGRDVWVQFGWLYVDTSLVLERFASGAAPVRIQRIETLDALADYLRDHGPRVAGIVCEAPSNPLLETCDLGRFERARASAWRDGGA